MKSIGYFPGCSLSGTAAEYDHSLRAVAKHLEIELRDVPDWICCGATSAHAMNHNAALCMAADTLAKAKKAGIDSILAPCAMCFQRLATASYEMKRNPRLPATLAQVLGESPNLRIDQVRALSLLNWIDNMSEEQLKAKVAKPLHGLKVACYYGCLLVRPGKVTAAADVETPRSMERIVTALGGEPVRWSMATECCGASFALSRKDAVLRLARRIYDSARKAGAEIIALACPMCHNNLDMRQAEYAPGEAPLPALYLTQLMGIAFGLPIEEMHLKAHFVPVEPAISKIG